MDDGKVQISLTKEQANDVFYDLSNTRDCFLLPTRELETINLLTAAIAKCLRELQQ